MAKQKNDNAFMLIRLQDCGVNLSVIAGRSGGLKGRGRLPYYENMDGVPIYRVFSGSQDSFLFPQAHLKRILKVARELRPDLIFCSEERNMRLALTLQRYVKRPIVLLVEDAGRILSGEAYQSLGMNFMMRLTGIPTGPSFWTWLCRRASALITCHPRDRQMLDKLTKYGKPVYYLPWPTHVPLDFQFRSFRNRSRGVYVGSLYPFKNTQEFEQTLPRILKETQTREFVVVGPGPHAKMIQNLQRTTSGAVKYIPELPRIDALQLIAGSYYAYTPVVTGGWGFIGDCWSMRTPIVMTHNDSYATNNVDALVAEHQDELIDNINHLYKDAELYSRLQSGGYEQSEKRKAESVGDRLYTIFNKALEVG